MTLTERIHYLEYICETLQDTNSIVIKKQIVSQIQDNCKDDFNYILEILAGKHKLGYTYRQVESLTALPFDISIKTFREYIQPLFLPIKLGDLSVPNISVCTNKVRWFTDFVSSIVNRTLKLGIGNCLLEKTDVAPMLAKKYEGQILHDNNGIFITEKLDGNRCIAQCVNDKWTFTSRNGKEMFVDFDMTGFDKTRIYDGEVMSRAQTINSMRRCNGEVFTDNQLFNETSGMINKHTFNKDLVYNIFDIVDKDLKYFQRRNELNTLHHTNDVRILPILQVGLDCITDKLDYIVKTGGEGLMINLGSGLYQQKRTNDLLKFKQIQTMDLQVVDWEYGNGKYEGMIGYLICEGEYKGNKISCKVGTGFSDEQRLQWVCNPSLILHKIIEVAYFSLSQNANTYGTTTYSLRFPRMKSIRQDKTETSEY